jgi:OPT family small oligopeptide transporter
MLARRAAQSEEYVMAHLNDPNFDLRPPPPRYSSVEALKDQSGVVAESRMPVAENQPKKSQIPKKSESTSSSEDYDDDSPYAEVRAAVPSIDDPSMPVNTFRTWFLGILYAFIISSLNQLFWLRYPSVTISSLIAQLTALPLGKFLEWALPSTRFVIFNRPCSLNPGPFNVKEHVVITVMADVVVFGAYATDIVATQQFFYGQSLSYSYQMLLILGTQLVGFSLGGFLRRFVVWPASMLWPSALVNSALFNTLHKNYGKMSNKRRRLSREKFFCIVLACGFVWYWIPGYLWTGISVFNWVCWAAPQNVVVNQLFGTLSGLGMSVLTLDWAVVSYMGSPLVTPWWSQANTIVSFGFFFWIITPILYYTNTWFSKFLPISSHTVFDNTAQPYNATAIITNNQFDVEKYHSYSPPFISTTQQIAYGLKFATFTAVIVHTFLWYRKDIARRFNSSLKDERDVHARLMQAYPEVPQWWYGVIAVASVLMLSIAIQIFPTELPFWGLLLALLLTGVLAVPLAMIQAITNQSVALNVMSELFGGYLFEGKPVANMIFKGIGVMGSSQAASFSSDMKLGHYMKIPPRVLFTAQILALFISCFVVQHVQNVMFLHITDICSPDQPDGFSCPTVETFANASLFWGAIGPKRLFNSGAMYNPLLWFFFIGAVAPIPFYYLSRRFPYSLWRLVNMPVFFDGIAAIPPASPINYSSWALTGFIFNFFVRRRHFRWWMQYNYILSAALDSGVALGVIFVFFTLQLPNRDLRWWGNDAWQNTVDANGGSLLTLAANATFGPSTWK